MDTILACIICFSGNDIKIQSCQAQAYWRSVETDVHITDCETLYLPNDGEDTNNEKAKELTKKVKEVTE